MAAIDDPDPPEYLEDPEAELSSWDDDIWANSEAEALEICRNIGKTRQCRLMSVRPLGRTQKRWRCTFRSYE